MFVALGHAVLDEIASAAEINQRYFRAIADNDVAIGPFQS